MHRGLEMVSSSSSGGGSVLAEKVLRRFSPEAVFLISAALLCTAELSILAHPGYWAKATVVAPAVMVDLALGMPFLGYLFLVRSRRFDRSVPCFPVIVPDFRNRNGRPPTGPGSRQELCGNPGPGTGRRSIPGGMGSACAAARGGVGSSRQAGWGQRRSSRTKARA